MSNLGLWWARSVWRNTVVGVEGRARWVESRYNPWAVGLAQSDPQTARALTRQSEVLVWYKRIHERGLRCLRVYIDCSHSKPIPLLLHPYPLSSLSLSCHDHLPTVATFWYIDCSRSNRCLASELSSGEGPGEGLREAGRVSLDPVLVGWETTPLSTQLSTLLSIPLFKTRLLLLLLPLLLPLPLTSRSLALPLPLLPLLGSRSS
jgi:hypothetical protein